MESDGPSGPVVISQVNVERRSGGQIAAHLCMCGGRGERQRQAAGCDNDGAWQHAGGYTRTSPGGPEVSARRSVGSRADRRTMLVEAGDTPAEGLHVLPDLRLLVVSIASFVVGIRTGLLRLRRETQVGLEIAQRRLIVIQVVSQ